MYYFPCTIFNADSVQSYICSSAYIKYSSPPSIFLFFPSTIEQLYCY
nr:MAG TPA: hypothetical protein [Caudoviricetes sp.]